MAIVLGRQSEMPHTLHAVFCLLHGTQCQPRDQSLHRSILNLCQQFLQFLRMHLIRTDMDIVSEIIDKRTEFFDFFCIRNFMGTVYKRQFLPEIILRHGFISRQHKIFDDLRGWIAVIRFDFHRMSLCIQDHLGLRKIKINGTTFPAFCTKQICHCLHIEKHLYKLFILFGFLRILQRNDLIYICITHTPIHIND